MENENKSMKPNDLIRSPVKERLKLIDIENSKGKNKRNSKFNNDDNIINVVEKNEDNLNLNLKDNKKGDLRRYTLNSHILNKQKTINNVKKENIFKKILHVLHQVFEHIIMQIFIILLSIFSLFHEDIKILSLPKTVDYPFHHVNEFIFFFFLLEFLVFILSQKDFIGSFYFYLDIVSLISLIPEVHLIWDPILFLIEDDSSVKIKEVLGNSHLAKASRASQAGSKASKYLRLLKLINFIKVVRVAKVVAHTNQIEKQIENKNSKMGLNVDSGPAQNLLKKRGIRIRKTNFNVNEIAIFLKYQKKTPIRSFKTTVFNNPRQMQEKVSKSNLPRLSEMKKDLNQLSNAEQDFKSSRFKRSRGSIMPKSAIKGVELDNLEHNLNNSYNKKEKIHEDFMLPKPKEDKKMSCKDLNPNLIEIKRNKEIEIKLDYSEAKGAGKGRKSNLSHSRQTSNTLLLNDNYSDLNTEKAENEFSTKEKYSKTRFKLSSQFTSKEHPISENKNKNTKNNYNDVIQEISCSSASNEDLEIVGNKTGSNNSSNLFNDKSNFKNVSIGISSKGEKPNKDDYSMKKYEKLENFIGDSRKNSMEVLNKEWAETDNKEEIAEKVEEGKINFDTFKNNFIENTKNNNVDNVNEDVNALVKRNKLNKAPSMDKYEKGIFRRQKTHAHIELSNNLNRENKELFNNLYNKFTNENPNSNNNNKEEDIKKIDKDKKAKLNYLPSLKETSPVGSDSNTSRSFSASSDPNDDVMDEDEEQRMNERIRLSQNKMNLMIKKGGGGDSQISNNNNNISDASKGNENLRNMKQGSGSLNGNFHKASTNLLSLNEIDDNNLDINNINNNNPDNSNENKYLKEIQNKANLKLDKKLTQNFTNRVILIIMVLLVVLPIIDLDFMFDLLYSKEVQPNYKFLCMDLIYMSMNLSLSDPQKYLPLLNSTIETCFYGYGYLRNYTSDRSFIKSFPQDLEFFLQLNFTSLDIYQQFNNLTHYFEKDHLELNSYKNYTKNLRVDIDYFDEIYGYDDKIKFTYYTSKVLFSEINSILSILKSFFVAVLLVFGTFLFTKDISFYVISPLEKMFAKLEILFNSLDNLNEHLVLDEDILVEKEKNGNKKNKKKESKKRAKDRESANDSGNRNKNKNKKSENENEDSKKEDKGCEIKLKMINNTNDKNKNSKNNFHFFCSNSNDASSQKTPSSDSKSGGNKGESLSKESGKKTTKKFTFEIDRVNFSIMKLLDLIAVSLGNPLLMMIPNCDLEKDLVINLKSPGVNFEGFILMLSFSNKENLIRKIGTKANKYFNKAITLFHSIGLIFCGQPYKIDDMDFLIWRKDKNSYLKNMFNYVQSLNEQTESAKQSELDSTILEKVLIPDDLNQYLSAIGGNISCMAGIKFINFFLKNLRKTIKVLSEAKVGLNLFCDYGTFNQGYGGSLKKMNEVFIGKPIFDLKKITEKTNSTNPNYPSLFINENLLVYLEDDIKKNIILHDIIKRDNREGTSIKLFRHYINYEMIQKEIKRIHPHAEKIKDYLKNDKINKKSILKESKEFLENLKTDKNNFVFIISSDNVYIELTANLNPIYKNLMNLAIDSYIEKDFNSTKSIFEDISKLIKSTNDNYDFVFNENINEWLKFLKNKNHNKNNETGKKQIIRNKTSEFY